jgi:hypothetical protein
MVRSDGDEPSFIALFIRNGKKLGREPVGSAEEAEEMARDWFDFGDDFVMQNTMMASMLRASKVSAAKKPSKKTNDRRIEKAFYKVSWGVQIPLMEILTIHKVGEKAIADGADDEALEKALAKEIAQYR